uniref:Poly [ADP-ribose] polymerase n=1 Tax=Leptobrachium leishanense TaxID=445787 RepID=A0A8C5PLI9_9ANUR
MSDPAVTAFLTKLLCANGGRLPRAQLTQYLELPQEQIDQILQEESERFPQAGELILAHCPIRICPEYIRGKEDKDDCGKLHLCCSHLRGTCWNSKKFTCKYSHNTQTEHNLAVLKANEVNSLNNEELKTILFQNDSSILPGTCKKYLHEKCDDDKCKWLHICGFFTSGVCNRKVCKKSHDLLETQTTLLLKQYGIPAVSIENLQMLSVLKYNANLQNQTEQDGNRKARGASRGRRGNRGRSHIRKDLRLCTGSRNHSATGGEQTHKSVSGINTDEKIDLTDWVMSWKSPEHLKPMDTDCLEFSRSDLKDGTDNASSVQHRDPASSGVQIALYGRTSVSNKVPSVTVQPRTTSVCTTDPSTAQPVPSNKSRNATTTDFSGSQQNVAVSANKAVQVASASLSNSQQQIYAQNEIALVEPTAELPHNKQFTNFNHKTIQRVSPTYSYNGQTTSPVTDNILKSFSILDVNRVQESISHFKQETYNDQKHIHTKTQPHVLPTRATEHPALNIVGKDNTSRPSVSRPTHHIDWANDSDIAAYFKTTDSGSSNHTARDEQSHKSTPGTVSNDKKKCIMSWDSLLNLDPLPLQYVTSKFNEGTGQTPSNQPYDPAPGIQTVPSGRTGESNKLPTVTFLSNGASSNSDPPTAKQIASTNVPTDGTSNAWQTVSGIQTISSGRTGVTDKVTSVSFLSSRSTSTTDPSTAKPIASVTGTKSTNVLIKELSNSQQAAPVLGTLPTNMSMGNPSYGQQAMHMSANMPTNMLSATSSNIQQTPVQANVCNMMPYSELTNTQQKQSSSDNTMKIPPRNSSNIQQTTLVKDIPKPASTTKISGTQRATVVDVLSKEKAYCNQEHIRTSTQPHVSLTNTSSIRQMSSVQPTAKCSDVSTVEIKSPYDQTRFLTNYIPSASSASCNIVDSGTRKRDSKKIDFTEICLANIWKYCKHEGNCPKMHYYLPYRWQVSCGSEWNDLEDMENIEKAYCDPKITSYFAVDFLKMKSRLNSVRRLCTPSSVLKHHEFVLTTEWLWYWRDENGIWVEYGKANTKQMSASITSAQLENIYLSNPEDTISFRAGQQLYQINFADMKQKNIFYNTKRDMCRRPKFLSYQDVRNLKGSTRSASTNIASSPLKSAEYPATWDKTAMPDIGHKLVDVPLASSEASSIQALFTKTLSGYVLKKISRVQNPSLWQLYQWKKEQILKTNCIANEKNLFHGTSSHNIPPICHENIDWRVCGANGTLFGQGSYFARDASYSHNYSPKNASGQRSMFMARVLVGDYVLGNPSYKRPPSKPGSQTQSFNSCVDDKHHPSIFVVFESAQIYPEYLIMYEEEKKSCSIS